MLGRNPDLNISLMSYSATYARKFNRQLQKTMSSERYLSIYPETNLGDSKGGTLRTADEFEIKDRNGSFKVVGREGSLTGI